MFSIFFVIVHGYLPRSAKWSNGRDCAQNAKVLANQIAGHTHTIEHDEEQLCYTETRIDAVQMSISKLDVSVAKATEIRRKQHPELVALITDVADATELKKVRAEVALWCMSVRA